MSQASTALTTLALRAKNFGRLAIKILREYPQMRFRDKDPLIHNASDAAACGRAITYKALKTPESNPVDNLGLLRMKFGNWVEKGILYDIISNGSLFGLHRLSTQGDAGEYDFYGTKWHGYRDFDCGFITEDGKIMPAILELKAKVGMSALFTIKETAFSKKFKIPQPDTDWGYSQQLSLYLRNAYRRTSNDPRFASPIQHGVLLYFLYADGGVACFVEFYARYNPEDDTVTFYKVVCDEIPECNGEIHTVIKLKDIADKWAKVDVYLAKKELAPPDFERKYDVRDPRVEEAWKKDLEAAIKGTALIGDAKCKYCSFKDKCAQDLGISLEYSEDEVKVLKKVLANK